MAAFWIKHLGRSCRNEPRSEGEIVWQVTLPAGGIGNPAIGEQGEIFVVDREGGLTAYSEYGEMIWHYPTEAGLGGIAGPVVSSDGSIYYTIGSPGTT